MTKLKKVSHQLAECETALEAERQQRSELEDRALEFQHIFTESLDILFILNPTDKCIQYVSNSVTPFLGYLPDELTGKEFSLLFPDEEETNREKILETLHTYDAVFTDQAFRRKDGVVVFMDFTITLIHRENRKDILVSLRPTEERHRAEVEQARRIKILEDYLAKVKLLSGFLPICVHCKKIRDEEGFWVQVEEYIRRYADVDFSHSICPECMKNYYSEFNHSGDDSDDNE